VAQLATRVIELRRDGLTDYIGTYDEYLAHQGRDHLNVEDVTAQAKSEQSARKKRR